MSKPSKTIPTTFTWSGTYHTWDEACIAANGDSGRVFSSARWMQRITQQLQNYRDEIQQHGIALPPRPSNLPLVCAMTSSNSIIDFGGSSGWCFDYLKNTLRNHAVSSYVVVENEQIVKHIQDTGLHANPVSYKIDADSLEQCDVLYCNSVLQYFESNAQLVDLIDKVRPAYILLDDLLAKGAKDYFSTQVYYDTYLPHRFLGLQQLSSVLSKLGYSQLLSAPFTSPILGVLKPLPMENLPAEYRLQYSLSMLWKRGSKLSNQATSLSTRLF